MKHEAELIFYRPKLISIPVDRKGRIDDLWERDLMPPTALRPLCAIRRIIIFSKCPDHAPPIARMRASLGKILVALQRC